MNPQPDSFTAVFGDKNYSMKIALMNNEGDLIILTKSATRRLMIDDNIFNPFHSGELIITNDFNVLENADTPYVFLGNGRDMLFIDILPDNGSDSFLLSLRCVVTECTEMVFQNSLCKKLTFVEYGQYAVNEKYCNALSITSSNNYLNTNASSSQTTGDLIKKIINTVFDNPADDFSLFDTDSYTNQIMFDQEGCGRINISPYGVMSYSQLLAYALQMHTHKDSPCILQHDRFSKKFQLVSLQRLFEENSRHVTEVFRFMDPKQVDAMSGDNNTGDIITQPNIKFNYHPSHFGSDSHIGEFYTETPAAKYGVGHFANESITSYSKNYSTFIYNLQSLSKTEYTKTFTNLFVRPFDKLFAEGAYSLQPNFYVNTDQQQQKWVDSPGTLPPQMTEKQFLNQKLVSLLYLNYTYIFKMTGNTSRESRSFVDIYKRSRANGSPPSRWDYNTLGRHFVTCVKHIFTHDTYMNLVETIKPYRITDPSAKELNISDYLKQ